MKDEENLNIHTDPTDVFEKPKDDEATYYDRVVKTFHMLDVRTAFTSRHVIEEARTIVNRGRISATMHQDMTYEQALKITRATLHPDTQQIVPLPLRVSMIVPMNMLVDSAMIMASTPRTTILAQWLNQSYNALHYYANRNASNEDTSAMRISAYIAATASAVIASLSIRKWGKQISSPAVSRLAPFAAVAAADLLNLAIMRQSEYLKGVKVYDKESGELIGTSKRCGYLAVGSCIAGRIFAAAPILILPPIALLNLEERFHFIKKSSRIRIPLLLAMVGIAIQVSVPLTFGLFRQSAEAPVRMLEPELHSCTTSSGQTVQTVTFNKGI